jgi:hypothetical protein
VRVLMVSDVDFPRVTGMSTSRQALAAARHASVRVAGWPIPRDPEGRLMQPRALAAALDQLNPAGFDLVRLHTRFLAQRAGGALGAIAWSCRATPGKRFHPDLSSMSRGKRPRASPEYRSGLVRQTIPYAQVDPACARMGRCQPSAMMPPRHLP